MLKNIIFALASLVLLAISPAILAAEQAPEAAVKAEVLPQVVPLEREAAKQATKETRPVNDNHVDYRYCLDLKTNQEIAACRYKK